MLAVAGWVAVDLGFTVPYAPTVSSLAAHDATVEKGPMFGLLLAVATIELITGVPKVFQLLNNPDATPPGDYNFDPFNLKGKTPEAQATMAEKEISNGRLAMMAFSGIVTQAALFEKGFPYA